MAAVDPRTHLDAAQIDGLTAAIERILPALERFTTFEDQDRSAIDRRIWQERLDEPLPRQGRGIDRVIDDLVETAIPYGDRVGNPGFCGWVLNAPTTSGITATLATTVAGSQRWGMQPFNLLEDLGLRWLKELLGIPAAFQGVFVSGGSTANLVGLTVARQSAYERIGIDAARDGLFGAPRGRVYGSTESHHCLLRAAGMLGLGRRGYFELPARADGTADPAAIDAQIRRDLADGVHPVAIVANAGGVNTGAVDPIDELADIAQEHGVWLHVDGAYGLFGLLDERVAERYRGLDRADSIVGDPHKWLAVPVGVGATFIRDRSLFGRALTAEPAEYIEGTAPEEEDDPQSPFDAMGYEFHNFTPELTAPSRGVLVWAVLSEIGADGIRDRVTRHLDFARRLADLVRADDRLELVGEPILSICNFRYRVPGLDDAALDELNARISAQLRIEGDVIPSATQIDGRYVIRPCFLNPRTREDEVDRLAAAVRRIGDELVAT